MATNIKYDQTDVLTYVAPSTVTSGSPIVIGGLLVVPLEDASTGAVFSAQARGRAYVPKTSAQAWAQGVQIYWTGTTTTSVQTGTLRAIGVAGEAAANPSSNGWVDLGLGIEADSDVGTLAADLASCATGKGTAIIGDELSGGTLKAKIDTCPTMAAAAVSAAQIIGSAGVDRSQAAYGGVFVVAAASGAGGGAKIALAEETGSGAHTVAIQAPDALASDITVTLPTEDLDMDDIVSTFGGADLVTSQVTVSNGSATGSSAADPAWIGATVYSCCCVSGGEQIVQSVAVAGDGAITVTLAAAQAAGDATYTLIGLL